MSRDRCPLRVKPEGDTPSRRLRYSGPDFWTNDFRIFEDISEDREFIEGSETFDYYHGNLPFVPSFDVEVTVKYRLWRNGPPPKNKQ